MELFDTTWCVLVSPNGQPICIGRNVDQIRMRSKPFGSAADLKKMGCKIVRVTMRRASKRENVKGYIEDCLGRSYSCCVGEKEK
jgi:hypothetical protein